MPCGFIRRALLVCIFVVVSGSICFAQQVDRLPSWSDGYVKSRIVDFVARVTNPDSSDFVYEPERVAIFDNDGTLWCEQPIYVQFAFAIDRIKAMAPERPEWRIQQPYRAVLEGDTSALVASGEKGLLQIMAATHAGMSTEDFKNAVLAWTSTARHPRFNRPYIGLVYQPMLELLAYLRANGFKTFIVSGGGVEFMRPWVEHVYDVPPEQIVGSSGKVKFEIAADGNPVLLKQADVEFIDDGPGKPVGINRFIGRRPIFAVGNSDGDLQMLEYAAGTGKAYFAGIVHHTDAEREYAYDRQSHIGKLDKALDEASRRNWTIVDMKRDWKIVFPSGLER
jgi:phosphoserine phosphatase